MAFFNFNANEIEPNKPLDPIPAGVYNAVITASEIAATKNGAGNRLLITWDVLDGPMKGRKVFDAINVQHQNSQAEEIGQRQLSTLCHAVGVLNVQDTTQLHNRPCAIRVIIRKDDTGQYADRNEVRDYRATQNTVVPPMAPAATARQAAPQRPAAPWGAK